MNLAALHRPTHVGRPTSQLTPSRPLGRDFERARPVLGADRLIGRWTLGEDGRLVRVWSLERQARVLVDRKRGSDA